VHEAVDVDFAHVLHLSVVEVREIALAEYAGVVDDDIDGAESLARGFDQSAAIIDVGKVGFYSGGSASRPGNRLHERFRLISALSVVDGDSGAVPSETNRNSAADAAGGACNQSDSMNHRTYLRSSGEP
jgi:hypothetical protein